MISREKKSRLCTCHMYTEYTVTFTLYLHVMFIIVYRLWQTHLKNSSSWLAFSPSKIRSVLNSSCDINLLILPMFFRCRILMDMDMDNMKIEYDRSSRRIYGFCTMSKKSTQSIWRCGRGEGCLHHRGSKSLSSQKLIDFTVLIWLSVGLTQAQQPLLVLYCVFLELQKWWDTAQFKSAKKRVLMSHIVWLIRWSQGDKVSPWYIVNQRLIMNTTPLMFSAYYAADCTVRQ